MYKTCDIIYVWKEFIQSWIIKLVRVVEKILKEIKIILVNNGKVLNTVLVSVLEEKQVKDNLKDLKTKLNTQGGEVIVLDILQCTTGLLNIMVNQRNVKYAN